MKLAASFFIACLFISLSQDAKAQQESNPKREGPKREGPKREGVITGRVSADGRPVAGARVFVYSSAGKIGDTQMIASDGDGVFKATGLSPGAYSVLTLAPGYVAPSDSTGPRKHRIGEYVALNLVKGGVITGRVTDEFGEPVVGVRVAAQKVRTPEGKPDFDSTMMNAASAVRETDDRGVYRIFGLEPGVYVVSLNGLSFSGMSFAQSRSEPPIYHPSSTRNAAAEVTVHSGGEAGGVDIRRRAMRGHSISGAVTGATEGGGFVNAVVVRLTRAADREPVATAALISEKNFNLRGVEDGEYDLAALRSDGILEFSTSVPRRVVVKGADISGIEVKLLKPGSIEGRVVIEPSKPSGACKSDDDFSIEEILLNARRDEKTPSLFAHLSSIAAMASVGGATPGDDGAFVLKNIELGRVRIETDLPDENWYVRAITQKSSTAPKPVDASQNAIAVKSGEKVSGLELTIAEGAASLKGKVVPANENVKLSKRIRVHLIPAEVTAANETLRYYEKLANSDGSFDLRNLAPGRYLLHPRSAEEGESAANPDRAVAWDASERAKLRREAEAAKNEIELKPCQRVKDHVLRW